MASRIGHDLDAVGVIGTVEVLPRQMAGGLAKRLDRRCQSLLLGRGFAAAWIPAPGGDQDTGLGQRRTPVVRATSIPVRVPAAMKSS